MTESWNSASTASEREMAADTQDSVSRNVWGAVGVLVVTGAVIFVFFGYLVPWMMGTAM